MTRPSPGDQTSRFDRRVSTKRKMRTRFVIVLEVGSQDATKMALVEHDHMIETVSPYRADYPFGERFCQGERGAIRTSAIPMLSTRFRSALP